MGGSKFDFGSLCPIVVGLGVLLMAVGIEGVFERVGAIACVAVETQEICAGSTIDDGEEDGGVLAIAVHILRSAPRNVALVSIVGVEVQAAQAQGGLGRGVENDSSFVGYFDLVPIDTIGRVLVVVAQLSADRRSGIQFDGLFPSAVWFGIGVEAVRGKVIDQLVAADARVAILPDVVGACRYIGDFEDDSGVAAIAIHILRRAPRNVGPIGIERVEIEAA